MHKLSDVKINSLVHKLTCSCGASKLYSEHPGKIQNKYRMQREMQEHVEQANKK